MLFVLSPAKSLDYASPAPSEKFTQPRFLADSTVLVKQLRGFAPAQIADLMHISEKLATLNVARYQQWSKPFTPSNAKACMFAFNGDVYDGLDAGTLDEAAIEYAQKHLRILSGLYGVLRPLDLMQPYRLEMGTKLDNARGENLYQFWGDAPTEALKKELGKRGDAVLVNLASAEYFKVVRKKRIHARIVTPVFEDWHNGRYKVISFHAKRARGLMVRYAIDHRIASVDGLKDFNYGNYACDVDASSADRWVFRRRQSLPLRNGAPE